MCSSDLGSASRDSLTGNDGNNLLDGSAGADTLAGGLGDDTYVIDTSGEVITESASAGTDSVLGSVSYTLASNLENLTLTGTANLTGTGNALNNVIVGNSGNNTLNGGVGADTLVGGAGNDAYVVNVATDVVEESAEIGRAHV